jgi:hypothetical protein
MLNMMEDDLLDKSWIFRGRDERLQWVSLQQMGQKQEDGSEFSRRANKRFNKPFQNAALW